MATVFFSYSHRDEDLRNELETALASLRREGLIDVWHDRRIDPGEDFSAKIDRHLEEADIILLLVSSYFIDSDYAYGIEMTRVMERHDAGEAKVIPIILRHTDWEGAPFRKLLALPPDGKPITGYPDLHEGLAAVSRGLRQAISVLGAKNTPPNQTAQPAAEPVSATPSGPRSSNLRLRRDFTDQDRDQFLDDALAFIATFFENSLAELERRNPGVKTRFSRSSERFAATIYKDGQTAAECTVWRGDNRSFADGIAYSEGRTGANNSYNEILTAENDGHTLFLRPLMGGLSAGNRDAQLTHQGAAEHLWGKLIGRLR